MGTEQRQSKSKTSCSCCLACSAARATVRARSSSSLSRRRAVSALSYRASVSARRFESAAASRAHERFATSKLRPSRSQRRPSICQNHMTGSPSSALRALFLSLPRRLFRSGGSQSRAQARETRRGLPAAVAIVQMPQHSCTQPHARSMLAAIGGWRWFTASS